MSLVETHRLLVDFVNTPAVFVPGTVRTKDWGQAISDFCLRPLRTALDKEYRLHPIRTDRVEFVDKTNSKALKVLAGFVAFTLWLPLTLIGIVVCLNSKMQEGDYALAKMDRFQPKILPSIPQDANPLTNNELLAAELAKIAADPSKYTQEHKKQMITAGFTQSQIPYQNIYWPITQGHLKKCYPTEMEMQKYLQTIFSKISDEELIEYLSELNEKPNRSVNDLDQKLDNAVQADWWPLDRYMSLAKTMITHMQGQKNGTYWTSWEHLRSRWQEMALLRSHAVIDSAESMNANDAAMEQFRHREGEKFNKATAEAIGNNTDLLFAFYRRGLYAMPTLSDEQLTILVKELNKSEPATRSDYYHLARQLMLQGNKTMREASPRIALIPLALGEDPLKWILNIPRPSEREWSQILGAIFMYKAAEIFKQPNQERDIKAQALASLMAHYLFIHQPERTQQDLSDIYKELCRLSLNDNEKTFLLVFDALAKCLQKHLGLFVPEEYTKAALACLGQMLSLPGAKEKAGMIYEAVMPLCAISQTRHYIQRPPPPTKDNLLQRDYTLDEFDAAVHAAMTGCFPFDKDPRLSAQEMVASLADLTTWEKEPLHNPGEERLIKKSWVDSAKLRRDELEKSVRDTLKGFPAPLVDIVLEYYIALAPLKASNH